MSTPDTMTTLVSAPWFDADGNPLPITPLPGLRPEPIEGLAGAYPAVIKPALKELLGVCCGLEGTVGQRIYPAPFGVCFPIRKWPCT